METTILIPARIRTETDLLYLKEAVKSAKGQGLIIIGFNQCEIALPSFEGVTTLMLEDVKTLGKVRNMLVREVKTKFFFFLDHDDVLPQDTIPRLEAIHPKAAKNNEYLYGSTIMFSDSSRLTIPAQEFDCEKLTRGVYFPNGVLQPLENFAKVGPWDETLTVLEDREWWIRGVEKGVCGRAVTFVTYQYRQNNNGMVYSAKGTPEWEKAIGYIRTKHKKFYDGGYTEMACCGKNKKLNTTRERKATNRSTIPVIAPAIEGEVTLRYTMATGSTIFYGAYTGRRYVVSQRNNTISVDPRDLITNNSSKPGLLQITRNGAKYFVRA